MELTPIQRTNLIWLELLLEQIKVFMALFLYVWISIRRRRRQRIVRRGHRYSMIGRMGWQLAHMRDLVGYNDTTCLNNLRMPIGVFNRLAHLLETLGGLTATRNVTVHEQLAMFLSILAHHQKNRVLQTSFRRSGYTISTHFKSVMNAVIRIHSVLLVSPQPIPDNSNDYRWKYFKGCLGAFDGTYVGVRVPEAEKGRFRNRKGDVSVNVLGVCDKNLNFIYLLTGWEGSAADSRVLRDAVGREDGLKVPTGQYYLVDSGYPNAVGFLAPYRGVRYHLHEFNTGPATPQNHKEYYNMRHAKARNAIERAFGILKSRWAILRSPSFYPIKLQNRIIMACCLLHNFIRFNIDCDPEELNVPEYVISDEPNENSLVPQYIESVEGSNEWKEYRDTIANEMYNAWLSHS